MVVYKEMGRRNRSRNDILRGLAGLLSGFAQGQQRATQNELARQRLSQSQAQHEASLQASKDKAAATQLRHEESTSESLRRFQIGQEQKEAEVQREEAREKRYVSTEERIAEKAKTEALERRTTEREKRGRVSPGRAAKDLGVKIAPGRYRDFMKDFTKDGKFDFTGAMNELSTQRAGLDEQIAKLSDIASVDVDAAKEQLAKAQDFSLRGMAKAQLKASMQQSANARNKMKLKDLERQADHIRQLDLMVSDMERREGWEASQAQAAQQPVDQERQQVQAAGRANELGQQFPQGPQAEQPDQFNSGRAAMAASFAMNPNARPELQAWGWTVLSQLLPVAPPEWVGMYLNGQGISEGQMMQGLPNIPELLGGMGGEPLPGAGQPQGQPQPQQGVAGRGGTFR